MQKPTILIVDDDPLNLKLLTHMLPKDDYATLTAMEGETAVKRARAEHPDLILMDIMMPVMDGYTATEILKQDPETKHIPIIMITALDGDEDKLKGLEAGADEFLNKPVNPAELMARVKSLLRLKLYQEQLKSRTESQESMVSPGGADAHPHNEVNLPAILIVEDEEKDLRLILNYLNGEAYQIRTAKSGEETMAIVLKEKIDLVLLDILLPGMDGFQVVERLRQMEEAENVQIVALTNLQDIRSKVKGIELGADDYLVKPVNKHELRVRIRSLVKKKAYLDSLRNEYASAVQTAITDRLTGLYNRAYFEHFIRLEIKRAERQNASLSLVMMDIDNFKTYNDTLGHLVGDRILRAVGKLIKTNIREIDLGARYGGEEFSLLLPNTTREGAAAVAERIRRMVFEHRFPPEDTLSNRRLTVSMGVGAYPIDAITVDGLIHCADSQLYRAKHAGKNRVCCDPSVAADRFELPAAP